MNWLWEVSFAEFIFVTVILGGGAAFMTGRAVARGWQSWIRLGVYVLLLAFALRFIHYGLFDGTFFLPLRGFFTALHYYVVDGVVLGLAAALGRQLTRAVQMTTQYHFLYRRSGLFGWRNHS